jgi:hypothetical protein
VEYQRRYDEIGTIQYGTLINKGVSIRIWAEAQLITT